MIIRVLDLNLLKEVFRMAKTGAFVRLPVAALQDGRLSRSALIVLATVIDRTTEEGVCELSTAQIAAAATVSERSVARALNQLEELEYITVMRRAGRKSKICHNDILPPKRRNSAKSKPSEPEVDIETALNLWEEAGILTKIGG